MRRPQPGELRPSSTGGAVGAPPTPVPLHFGEYQRGVGKGVTIPRPHSQQPRPHGRAVCSRGCVSAERGGADGKTRAPNPVVNTRLHNSPSRRCEGRGAWRVGQSPVYPTGCGFPRGADGSLPLVALPAEPPGSRVPPRARCGWKTPLQHPKTVSPSVPPRRVPLHSPSLEMVVLERGGWGGRVLLPGAGCVRAAGLFPSCSERGSPAFREVFCNHLLQRVAAINGAGFEELTGKAACWQTG